MSPKMEEARTRAKRKQLGAIALNRKAAYMLVCAALKDRHDVVHDVKMMLVDKGVLDRGDNILTPREGSSGTAPKAEEVAVDGDNGSAVALVGSWAFDEDLPMCPKWKEYRDLPPAVLVYILGKMEPASLSFHALRALARRGSKAPPKAVLNEIHEHLTDIDVMQSLTRLRTVAEICLFSCDKNEQLGRRGRDLVLPPCWNGVHGMCKHNVEDARVSIRCKGMNDWVVVPDLEVGHDDVVRIDMNFSLFRAALVVGDYEPLNLQHVLARAGKSKATTPQAKRKRCHEDRGVEDLVDAPKSSEKAVAERTQALQPVDERPAFDEACFAPLCE